VAMPDLGRAHGALKGAGVSCSLREGAIRMSPHCFTTVEEMERVAVVLDSVL